MTSHPSKPRSKRGLYVPFVLVGLLFAAYTAYWFFAKGKIETGLDDWITEQRAEGAEIEFTSKRIHGYPYRFALTVQAPRFRAPDASLDWRGEKLQVAMQPWNFNHAIIRSSGRNEAIFANGQSVTALIGEKSAASLTWDDSSLTEFGLTLDTLDLITVNGDVAARTLTANLTQGKADGTPGLFALDWDHITLAPAMVENTGAEVFGTELQASRLRMTGAGFGMFGEAPEREAEIAQLLLNWGPLKLGAKGKFDIDAEGYPNGTLRIRLDDPDTLRDGLREAGQLSAEAALLIGSIESASKDGGFLPVPLRNGAVTILGQALAPVPRVAPPLADAPAAAQ